MARKILNCFGTGKYFAMLKIKLLLIGLFLSFALLACAGAKETNFVIADSKKYEATIFRQNCAICHGPEGSGKKLSDGTVVPSLRTGDFKAKTPAQIYKQISEGGNGMLPFNRQLSEREIQMMTDFVYRDLRGN